MQLTRRSFLQLLGVAAPAAVIAPTYFFAPIGGWKSDVIINPADGASLIFMDLADRRDRPRLYTSADFMRPRLEAMFPVIGSAALVRIIEEQAEAMRSGREWRTREHNEWRGSRP